MSNSSKRGLAVHRLVPGGHGGDIRTHLQASHHGGRIGREDSERVVIGPPDDHLIALVNIGQWIQIQPGVVGASNLLRRRHRSRPSALSGGSRHKLRRPPTSIARFK